MRAAGIERIRKAGPGPADERVGHILARARHDQSAADFSGVTRHGQPVELRAKGAADIEVVHQAPRTRGKQHVAAVDIGGIRPTQVDGRASDGAE